MCGRRRGWSRRNVSVVLALYRHITSACLLGYPMQSRANRAKPSLRTVEIPLMKKYLLIVLILCFLALGNTGGFRTSCIECYVHGLWRRINKTSSLKDKSEQIVALWSTKSIRGLRA